MKQILLGLIFLITTTLTFSIPDFNNLKWGYNEGTIRGFYPNLRKEFFTNEKVKKYSYFYKNSKFSKTTFYLYEDNLYKIINEFNLTKINPSSVKIIFNDLSKKWGNPTHSFIDENFDSFDLKGNKQTWIKGTTYISLIGEDRLDKKGKLIESRLTLEYGLIDPKNRKDNRSLNELILGGKKL